MAPVTPREWLEVEGDTEEDGNHYMWMVDVTAMMSTYQCIFGCGCIGAWGDEKNPGCCASGAHFRENEDPHHLDPYVERMIPEDADNYAAIQRDAWLVRTSSNSSAFKTAVRDGACIFYNQAADPGCSLHVAAMRLGEDYRDWKPEICSLVPLHVGANDTHKILTMRDRDDHGGWGKTGDGSDGWWCVEDPAAYAGSVRLYVGMKEEIRRVLGEHGYGQMHAFCHDKEASEGVHELDYRSAPVSITLKRDRTA